MITNKVDGDLKAQFDFTVKDTPANEVMVEVFNIITELAQAGVLDVQIIIQEKPYSTC